MDGSTIGRLKAISSRRPGTTSSTPSSAAARPVVHHPWTIAFGKPKAFAGTACRWMGLMSPVTRPKARPVPSGTGIGTSSSHSPEESRCGTADSSAPLAERLRDR